MTERNVAISSGQPDPHVLAYLGLLDRICLVGTAMLAGVELLAWLFPPLQHLMAPGWDLTKADTAIALLSGVAALALEQPRRSAKLLQVSQVLAVWMVFIGIGPWMLLLTGHRFGLAASLALLPWLRTMPNMSLQTGSALVLLGVIIVFLRARKNFLSRLMDGLTLALLLLLLIYTSGYIFGAVHLFGPSLHNRIAPQTLIGLFALFFVAFSRRAEYGVFAIFLGDSIGPRIARIVAPLAIIFPYAVPTARAALIRYAHLESAYANAITTSILSVLAFAFTIYLVRRIQQLENAIRILSLHDELTGLYNRRGFYVLAEQTQSLAHRAGKPFTILFIDVDGLKQVNDDFGHEVGSALLAEIAGHLTQSFRETDVLGRLGGDEFAVACTANSTDIRNAIQRLEDSVTAANAAGQRPYTIHYSSGHVTSDGVEPITIDAMLKKADDIMYETKRNKHHPSRRMMS